METGLAGKRVLVTGGAGGIGSACVRAFAAEGAEVVVHYNTSRERAEELAAAVGGHYKITSTEVFGFGTGILAYTLGMRHAFDADHIAAIDNTTRKLLQDGKRPLGTGFFFSLGHSTIVFSLAAGLAALVLPALAGHAGQKTPRGLSLPLDTAHLTAASIWLGGLIGLVVFWLSVGRAARPAALAYVVS